MKLLERGSRENCAECAWERDKSSDFDCNIKQSSNERENPKKILQKSIHTSATHAHTHMLTDQQQWKILLRGKTKDFMWLSEASVWKRRTHTQESFVVVGSAHSQDSLRKQKIDGVRTKCERL